ncbi:hypothetical protein [Colwellia psychrerythraea]|uniref:Uncharacterized protein n=1 Tax=Colwellia psychrerythraea TaxID=28229 RepID=A0A099K9L8_COLPS|nr:hypothetical protein [Colwellia psychrerythraea]KGJ87424.1 hypothetical protein GAB14E_4579 [Colwellia psychrerythraea]
MQKRFRENKYLNESGSKTGSWYINRVDYFQFHAYPKANKHKLMSLAVGVSSFFLALKLLSFSLILSTLLLYISYLALLTFILLKNKICRYKGYFLYPRRIITYFRGVEVSVDLNDFDTIATLNKK